jgi:hypothetical protein
VKRLYGGRVETFATSKARRGSIDALYAPSQPVTAEHTHTDFVSERRAGQVHRAGVRWEVPTALDSVVVRWRDGWRPRVLRILALTDAPSAPVVLYEAGLAVAETTVVGCDNRPLRGVVVEQAAGGGSANHPDVLRIASLTPVFAAPPQPLVALESDDGAMRSPELPTWCDGRDDTCLDVSDAATLIVELPEGERRGCLLMRVERLDGVGSPRQVRDWLESPGLVECDGQPLAAQRWIHTADAGLLAGTVGVALTFDAPPLGVRLRVAVPFLRPFALAIRSLVLSAKRPDGPGWLLVDVRPSRPVAGSAHRAPRLAASLGAPGHDFRVGIAPNGRLMMRLQDGPADCLHVAFAVGGCADIAWQTVSATRTALRRVAIHNDVRITQTLRVPLDGAARLNVSTTAKVPVTPLVARRHWLAWRPLPATLPIDFEAPPHDPPVAHDAPAVVGLPADLAGIRAALLQQAPLFVRTRGAVSYGVYPSPYDDDVFGLEEGWLFEAVAMHGDTSHGLAMLRATYLRASHLDAGHDLHDLRIGLLPWQTERILALCGRDVGALHDDERALLAACAEEIIERRLPDAPERVATGLLPGLLPATRYGGDLGFVVQSLHTDAACCVGLAAAGRLLQRPGWCQQATAYRRSICGALEALVAADGPRLHSGDHDPGDYHQLMVSGVFDTLGLLDPNAPMARAIDATLHSEERMLDGLPRFSLWGGGTAIDPHYCLGFLLQSLWRGERSRYVAGLEALLSHGMDARTRTFAEVTPLRTDTIERFDALLPGRCLSWAAPCVGGVGVALLLLRHAMVTELPGAGGAPGDRLRFGAGIPASWLTEPLTLRCAPTFVGPVSARWTPTHAGVEVTVDAPDHVHVEVVAPSGQLVALAAGARSVRLS